MSIEELSRAHVVLTTFTTFRRDAARFCTVFWWRLVLDESAQHLRTLNSQIGQLLRNNIHAAHRWLLSGTPIDERLPAIASQLAFLGIRGMLATPEWWQAVQLRLSDHQASVKHEALRVAVRALQPVMIRHSHEQRFAQ